MCPRSGTYLVILFIIITILASRLGLTFLLFLRVVNAPDPPDEVAQHLVPLLVRLGLFLQLFGIVDLTLVEQLDLVDGETVRVPGGADFVEESCGFRSMLLDVLEGSARFRDSDEAGAGSRD